MTALAHTNFIAETDRNTIQGRPQSRLAKEALSMQATLWRELPLPPQVVLKVHGLGNHLVRAGGQASSTDRGTDSTDQGTEIHFDRDEWAAIVEGTKADRLWPHDFLGMCERKRRDATFRVTEEHALDGAQVDTTALWSAQEVMERLGVEVISVGFESALFPAS